MWSVALNSACAVVMVVAAVYMARFEDRILHRMRREFVPLPMLSDDYPFTRREALEVKEDIRDLKKVDSDQWIEINRIRDHRA